MAETFGERPPRLYEPSPRPVSNRLLARPFRYGSIGISRRRVNGVEPVRFNRTVCHAGIWRREGGERGIVDGMPSNNLDLHGFIRFLFAAANDDRLDPRPLLAVQPP